MTVQTRDLRCYVTQQGFNAETQAAVSNAGVALSTVVVGSGLLEDSASPAAQTGLISQERSYPINRIAADPDDGAVLIVEAVIPANDGGFVINEVGIKTSGGVLYAYARQPGDYKPTLAQGAATDYLIQIKITPSNASTITLKIDPAVVLASRAYVDQRVVDSVLTDAELLAQIRSVDGVGSGLDADTLDGKHANELLLASDYSSLAKDSQITTSSGLIGALPIGANLQANANYFHGSVNLDAGIYMVLMYGWLDQLSVSGSGINMNIRLMTGIGLCYGTHRSNITSGYQESGIYHTGLLVLKTAATVTADYTSYQGSSFVVPSVNSESFRFVRIR